jgi:hypothetical protein
MSTRVLRATCLIAVALVAALALAACGTAPTVSVQSHELHLRLDEYQILPRSVSVPPGPLKIVARNVGILTHNVALEGTRNSRGQSVVLDAVPTVLPGQTGKSVTLSLEPGTYALLSTVANQSDLGMTATLIVRAR